MQLDDALCGATLSSVESYDHSWGFAFSSGVSINVQFPWRIVVDGSVCIAGSDDGQRFGLTDPIDAAAVARKLLVGKAIVALSPGLAAGDLILQFEGASTLQLIADSAGYEAWVLSGPTLCVVGRGGDVVTQQG